MAKKKSKKSQKQIESASPPDSAPIPSIEETTPLVPEAPSLTAETAAIEPTPDDQPLASPGEGPTSVPPQDPEDLHADPNEAQQTSATEPEQALGLDLDPPVREEEETDPQAASINVTEPQAVSQDPEDIPATPNEVERPLATEASDATEAVPALEQELLVTKEEAIIEPGQENEEAEAEVEPTEETAPQAPVLEQSEITERPDDLQATPNEAGSPAVEAHSIDDERTPSASPAHPEPLADESIAEPTEDQDRLEKERLELEELALEQCQREAEAKKQRQEQEKLEEEARVAAEAAAEAQQAVAAEEDERRRVAESLERERLEQERLEQERLAQEQLEQERLEQERLAQEQLEQERLEQERLAQEQLEQERLEQERLEQERLAQEQLEQERLEQERLEQERLEQERLAQEQLEQERLEQERLEQERLEQERLEQERLEQERLAQEQLEQERLEQERLEQERLEQERLEQERLEQERLAQEQLEQERLEQERLEQERLEQERLEQERLEQERVIQERFAEERLAKQRLQEAHEAAQAIEKARQEEQRREELERLEQERVERDRLAEEELEESRLLQEAQAREEEQRLEQEAAAEQRKAELKSIEQAREEAESREDEQCRELERLEHSRVEQERHVREIQEAAEQARKEAKAKKRKELEKLEQIRAEQDRVDYERLEREAWEAAEIAQQEVDDAVTARIVADQAPTTSFHERVLSSQHMRDPPAREVPVAEPVAEPPRAAPSLPAAPSLSGHLSASAMLDQSPRSNRSVAPEVPKLTTQEAGLTHPSKPQAVTQLITEDDRPPAPSPPVGKVRPRHIAAFDSEDDSDSALVTRRPFRSGVARDSSQYPHGPLGSSHHQPPLHRSAFASRVPVEPTYPNPPPPPPPGYHHPGYYAPTAPPHYQNHGYGMSQGYPNPNPYGPASHSSSSPYQDSWNQYPPGYPPYGSPPLRQDSSGSRDYPTQAIEGRSAIEDGSGDVFSRIAQAIPDLHVLLARYKETHGQLSVREELLRRASAEQEEKLRVKDDEIDDLKEKLRNLENKHSTTMNSWESRYKELEDVHRALERTSAEEKARFWKDFDDWKTTTNTKHDAEKIALAIHFDKKLREADARAEDLRQEAAAAFAKEKDELSSQLEAKLGTTQHDHEEVLKLEREAREVWLAEREMLIKAHQEDRDSLLKDWDEQRVILEARHKKSKDESDKAWIELHADAIKKAEEERARAEQLAQEKEELLRRYSQLKVESRKEKEIIKSVASNLESEKSRLEKMMECYGDIAEIKSKGDTYYLVSFSQLQKQIFDLASTHFVHLPVRPPPEDLGQVPSNVPSFLGDTIASRQVRAAYIAHTVSKLITYRVFGPFLFSLGRRYDKADSLFLSMSNHIRDKSTRKEAIWRQQTLLAAFTSSGAKQRINTAAGTVVEEIVNAIKHFADPKEEEGIKIAVKRIVKLAAETWRFARLEREMISATMPALHDEEHKFTSAEYWPAYRPSEATTIASLAGTSPPADAQPQLLLRLFPVIYRESKHENFQGNGEKRDDGCVFHRGLALYDDAEPVVARMEELKSAGLPPFTTVSTSPTDEGKFPPPVCPPPRDPLPTPPDPHTATETKTETAEKASIRPKPVSRPISPKNSTKQAETPLPSPSIISSLKEPPLSKPVRAYKRPAPESIAFASPRNLIGLPVPVESLAASQPPRPRKAFNLVQPVSTPEALLPALPPYPPPPPPPRVVDAAEEIRHQTSMESAILPPSFSRSTTQETARELATSLDSRSGTPPDFVSSLFEAIDEIESIQPHRTRTASTSHARRRSTHTRRSAEHAIDDELTDVNPRTDIARRTSGYATSTRTSKTADSERTDRTDKTDRTDRTDRTDKSARDKLKYMCESRSAAIKALYPNGPMAGPSASGSSKNSGKSEKSERKKDRDSRDSTKDSTKESKRESRELKRVKSIPDNGTWDTNSIITNEEAVTRVSTNVPYPSRTIIEATREPTQQKRESRELRRKKSIPDNGTWDTNSTMTSEEIATHVSTNVPYPSRTIIESSRGSREFNRGSRELKRRESFSDVGTWDTNSIITSREAPTTVSTNVPYPSRTVIESSQESDRRSRDFKRRESFSDAGTWDTNSIITSREAPTTVSTNVAYPSRTVIESSRDSREFKRGSRELRRRESFSDVGTWDTNSIITSKEAPTTVSTNVAYPSRTVIESSRQERELKRRESVSDNGTWDTNSVMPTHDAPTHVSKNVPYPT